MANRKLERIMYYDDQQKKWVVDTVEIVEEDEQEDTHLSEIEERPDVSRALAYG